ncbi:MAG: DUF3883 domain-containing protein, partial [Nitrospirae bacterium]|nr:DUF3883 domain-containing protein [Nitrospirota bacterium]
MPTEYSKISEENQKKYGTDIGRYGSVLLAHLYSDRTHFIYELLQNAEDAGAKLVNFNLYQDRLEVQHNGKLFDSNDVRGICGLVEGTKKDDLTKIGKFGIGFKSVYAYTATPKVYSGEEAFCIRDYVLPEAIDDLGIKNDETLFVFPFNHGDVSPEGAYNEISKRLRNMGARTILFLNNIEEISWSIEGQDSGNYIRDLKSNKIPKRIYILSKIEGKDIEEEEWLFCEKTIKIQESNNLKIEVAFKIGRDKSNKEVIVPVNDSRLIVFFPTEKPTYLNFLIQGPYKTTPTRENIPLEDGQNKILIEETGDLVAESISLIKQSGCLDINFLQILPIIPANKGDVIYAAIFDKVKAKFLSDEELLPASDGKYTKAGDAILARGKDLTEILDNEDIEQLFSRRNWLSVDITSDRTRELRTYLINELKIKVVAFEEFAKNLTPEFLQTKNDDWLIQFYRRLLEQRSLWNELRTKSIIRLDDNSHTAPYDVQGNIQVYLPTESKSKYKTVKKEFVENEDSLKFLKELGIKSPDIFAEIREFVLPKYSDAVITIEDNEYLEDFEKLLNAFNKDGSDKAKKELLGQLSRLAFIKAYKLVTKEEKYLKPSDAYLNTDELLRYFDGYDSAFFVSDVLYSKFEKDKLTPFLMNIGVVDNPRPLKIEAKLPYEQKRHLIEKTLEYYGHTYDISADDYEYEGLGNILKKLDKDKSLLIWRMLLRSIEKLNYGQADNFFKGEYCWSYYGKKRSAYFDATFLKMIKESSWLFDKKGELKRPSEITFSELSDAYDRNYQNIEVLKERLKFKSDVFDQLPEDEKNKLALLKDRSLEDIKKLIELADKQKAEKAEIDGGESWKPEVAPAGVREVIGEAVTPPPGNPPDLEGQRGGTSDPPNIEKEITLEEPEKITPKHKKEIGKWGEEYVLRYLKEIRFKDLKVEDTEEGLSFTSDSNEMVKAVWLNIKSDTGKGYDFVLKINDKESEYIEVKTKLHEEDELIKITGTQWEFARKLFDSGDGEKYWIYKVVNAGQENAKIEKLQNPIKLCKEG